MTPTAPDLPSARPEGAALLLLLVVALVPAGCSRSEASSLTVTSASRDARPPSCPIGVVGARVAVDDSPRGVSLRVIAPPDRIAEVRQRVRDAAQLHGAGAHQGLGHDGQHMGAERHGLRLTELPPVEASVADVPEGARLDLTARLPEQIDALRTQVRARVEIVNAGPCD